MASVVLYGNKRDCCGCSACMNICPKHAISMQEDEYGFLYPNIDSELCVGCGACKKVCGYQNLPQQQEPKKVYAAVSRDEEQLRKSASGGVFAVLAKHILEIGGVVYGAALLKEKGVLTSKHIRVENVERLVQVQGSKYVQSEIGETYRQAKEDLAAGTKVLFSGTPCQIAGLKKYLEKEDSNLLTVEVICHGVPNGKFFRDFIKYYEWKLGGEITEFYFRDKSKEQYMLTRCVYLSPDGKRQEKLRAGGLLAYIFFFSKSYTCRLSCYSCPFAVTSRVADITIGDYWGFHEEYPQKKECEGLSNGKGISCILVNTEYGNSALQECREAFILMESEIDKVTRHNEQLNRPSQYSSLREQIMELYKSEGYPAVDTYFCTHYKKERLKCIMSGLLPKGLKRSVKRMMGK